MGLLKGYAQDWLDDIGYSLGYDWDTLPTIEEMEEKNIILYNLWNKMGDSYFRRHYPEDERMSSNELFKK